MTLDALLRQYLDPVLAPAGLGRVGRRYELVSPAGDVSTLHVDRRPSIGGETAFDLGITVLPASQLDWLAWQAGTPVPDYRPDRADALWRYPLPADPGLARSVGGSTWAYTEDADRCGRAVAATVAETGLPLLLMGQDRRAMLASLETVLRRFGRLAGTPERARVLLLIDAGRSAELDAALAGVADDPAFLAWATARSR